MQVKAGVSQTMSVDEEHGPCLKTFATLCVYLPAGMPTETVSEALALAPSSIQEGSGPLPRAWFLSTEGQVDSRDVRRHIDWILDRVAPSAQGLGGLQQQGARADIFCYWLSRNGHGGPTLSPRQTSALGMLQLDCGFDVYFGGESAG